MAYNFQTRNNKIKLFMEHKNVAQKVLFGNVVLTALMSLIMVTVQEKVMRVLWVFKTKPIMKM
jgi:hypothetical protein